MLRDTSTLPQDSEKTNLELVESAIAESFDVVDALERAGFQLHIPNLLPFDRNDDGNSRRLLAVFGPYVRWCEDFKKWLVYDGRRWQIGAAKQVKKAAKYVMAKFLWQAVNSNNQELENYARRSLDSHAIRDTLESFDCEVLLDPSRSEGDSSRLDSDPYLLNCLNGTLQLPRHANEKPALRAHDPHDYITKLVRHNYDPDADCGLFTRFIDRIMGGGSRSTDAERVKAQHMVPYLQRALGSALTGDVTDKAIFVLYGQGDNGKTTLLETIRYVLEEYSAQVLVDTLVIHTQRQRETSTSLSDLAALRGARFVTTSETEQGQHLAEAKIKYLTSGMGEIKTCRKYENPITFLPTHHLFVDGNYRPVVRGGDAIWDRLCLIPFTVRIPKTEIDKGLGGKLKWEAEGILRWLVDGCQSWSGYRLTNPPEVNEAAREWREQDDPISSFLDECCELAPERADLYVKSHELWSAYQHWAEREKERHPLTREGFAECLKHLSCWPCQHRYEGSYPIRSWGGIALKPLEAVSNEP